MSLLGVDGAKIEIVLSSDTSTTFNISGQGVYFFQEKDIYGGVAIFSVAYQVNGVKIISDLWNYFGTDGIYSISKSSTGYGFTISNPNGNHTTIYRLVFGG